MSKLFSFLALCFLLFGAVSCSKKSACSNTPSASGPGIGSDDPFFGYNGKGSAPKFSENVSCTKSGNLITIKASYPPMTEMKIIYDASKETTTNGNTTIIVPAGNITYMNPAGTLFASTNEVTLKVLSSTSKYSSGSLSDINLYAASAGAFIYEASWGRICVN